MGFFGKLLGKKKEDDFGVNDTNTDLGMPPPIGTPQDFNDPLGTQSSAFGFRTPPTQPIPQMPPREPTPEDFGFERVTEKENRYHQPSYASQPQNMNDISLGKDLEIISAKLDAIKAELDSMNQRMKRLERIALDDNSTHHDKWSY